MDRALQTSGSRGPRDDSRSEREFARARRHSRLVSLMKVGLPLVAAVIVVGGIAVTWFARSLPDNLSANAVTLEDGRLVMEDPRMSGFDKNDRPYSMIAERAIQSISGGGIDLDGIKANVTVGDDSTADILAAKGHYDPETQQLRLYDDIKVDTTSGMTIRLSEASIDLSGGNMIGAGPVEIETPNQTIEAGSLNVQNGGKNLSFGDRVKMTLIPSSDDSPESGSLERAGLVQSESN